MVQNHFYRFKEDFKCRLCLALIKELNSLSLRDHLAGDCGIEWKRFDVTAKTIRCRRCGRCWDSHAVKDHVDSAACTFVADSFDITEKGYHCRRCGTTVGKKPKIIRGSTRNLESHRKSSKCSVLPEFDQVEERVKCRRCGTEVLKCSIELTSLPRPLVTKLKDHLETPECKREFERRQEDSVEGEAGGTI